MEEDSKKWLWWGIPVVVVVGAIAALYYGRKHKEEPPSVTQVAEAPIAAPPASSTRHPIEPDTSNATPLPALGESDGAMKESIAGVFGRALDPFLVPKDLIRHIVATIDNLPRKKVAIQTWPLVPTAGAPVVSGEGDALTWGSDNVARYAPIMTVVRNTDTKQLAAVYKRFYPLFQQAYTDLGYPDGYFNNRLVEVIDHLLQTPEVQGPIRLTQPGVFYQFADPALEERSAGQKLLIRMGGDNAAAIKLKLRELRREIAKQPNV